MEKTLGDLIKNFASNYILPRMNSVGGKETELRYPSSNIPEKKDSFGTKKLSMTKCREVAEQCPLLMKGIRKKSMDSIRAWHVIDTIDEATNPVKHDLQLLYDFEQRNNLKLKWVDARVASYVYGDGYLLITFQKDEDTKLSDPPSKEAYPWAVDTLNPEFITELDYYPKHKEYYRKRGIKHFHYENYASGEDYWIHPDRLIHFPSDKLPNSEFGNSKLNLLRNVIKSKINVDIACGEILAWFAHGVYNIGIDNCTTNDVEYWTKIANKHPGAWIHDKERESIETVSPDAIDPKPYYEYLVLNIAAALIMPVHVLVGIQMGRVTGAEVGTSDYYKDVKDDQDLIYTPLLVKLYSWILKGHNFNSDEKEPKRKWKYKIIWNPIYIDELSEAEILRKRSEAVEKLYGSNVIDIKEARQIVNKGQIMVDIEKTPKPPKRPIPSRPALGEKEKPAEKEKPSGKENLYEKQLDEATKAMIRRRKEIVEAEKKLGEQVLKEQEDVSS